MQFRTLAITTAVSALALGACASAPRIPAEQRLSIYEEAAGDPVPSFRYFGSINGWTALDDGHIALWTRAQEAWLLSFHGRCKDVEWASVISVTDQAGRVYAGTDKVVAHGSGADGFPCRIREIRPLDTAKIRTAEQQARDGAQASGT